MLADVNATFLLKKLIAKLGLHQTEIDTVMSLIFDSFRWKKDPYFGFFIKIVS
jgi:hypothetical protein